jgi:predicted nucleotidyltransferase
MRLRMSAKRGGKMMGIERLVEDLMRPSDALKAHRAELRQLFIRFGVLRPRVFGSVVSGTDAEDSDLDILVDPAPTTTLLTIARLQNEAEALLGVTVDVQTPGSLSRRFRHQVLEQAVPV